MNKSCVRKILVIRGGGLGDFILTFPLLRALRHEYPEAKIQLLGHLEIADLALNNNLADKIFSLESDSFSFLFREDISPGTNSFLSDSLKEIDLVISFLRDSEGIIEKNLRKLIPKVMLIGMPVTPGIHAAQHFLNEAGCLKFHFNQWDWKLDLPPGPLSQADDFIHQHFDPGQPVIAVHPGSGSEKKNWPTSNFANLIEELYSKGFEVLLIEGEAEQKLIGRLREMIDGKLITAPHLSLPVLAGILRRCHLLIGNDSGVSHLGGVTGIPVIALFGPTDPTIWKPLGGKTVTLSFKEATVEGIANMAIALKEK
jgi:ADP-heptose:LPS heptosyltransferase